MKFPVSVLPTITIIGNTFNFLIMLVIIGNYCFFYGIEFGIYLLQLPYYLLCMYAFLFSSQYFTSTISALVRDFQLLVQSTMRLLFLLTPIFWSIREIFE